MRDPLKVPHVPDLELAKHGVWACPRCDHFERKPGPCPACTRHAEDASDD